MPYRPNFPIPEDIHAELMCLQLMIPNDPTWKSVVNGLLYELQYWFNWQRDDANSGRECAAVWKEIYSSIDWSTMSCCCPEPTPIQYRFTDDGTLEKSTDGGETWLPAPENDPRNNSPQFPPLASEDPDAARCVAATGMIALIKEQVGDQLTDDMGRYTIGQLINDWINTMINDGGNILDALVVIAQNQLFALGITALRAALTDPVYETLLCIFFCAMADDGSFNNAAVATIMSDVSDQIGGIAGVFLNHLIELLGSVGLTNLARSKGATTGDCSECTDCPSDCAIYTFGGDLTQNEDGSYDFVCNVLTSGFYYGNIANFPNPGVDPCIPDGSSFHFTSFAFTSGDATVNVQQRCTDCENDALASKIRLIQYRNAAPWSVHFEVICETC